MSGVHGGEGGAEPRGEVTCQVSCLQRESQAAGPEPGTNPEYTACVKYHS